MGKMNKMLMRCTRDKGVFYADTKKQDAGKEIPSPLLLALRHRFVRNLNKEKDRNTLVTMKIRRPGCSFLFRTIFVSV